MTLSAGPKRRLADAMMGHAERSLRRKHPEWADAMASESLATLSDDDRLRWSVGCVAAGYRAPGALEWAIYPTLLGFGIALMTAYQWSVDENSLTVAMVSLIGVALGVLQPRRFWLSGTVIGLVVAAVNTFETITGVLPAYETYHHSLQHDARWIVLVAPALFAAVVGGYVGRKLRAALDAPV